MQVPEALERESGWRSDEHGLLVGSLRFLISRFVDPTVIPEVEESPELMRTTLVKRGGKWLTPEYCESMMKKEELDEQFFDDDAVIPSIAIFSYEPAPPEDMGFFAPGYKKLENREQRKKEAEQAIEEITRPPPEKEVECPRDEGKKDEDLECQSQLSPADVDKVLLNGVELTKDSSLAALRAACSVLGISGSGSKLKVYAKILNHNKKMEMLNAKSLASKAKAQETREALGQSVAKRQMKPLRQGAD